MNVFKRFFRSYGTRVMVKGEFTPLLAPFLCLLGGYPFSLGLMNWDNMDIFLPCASAGILIMGLGFFMLWREFLHVPPEKPIDPITSIEPSDWDDLSNFF